MLSSYKSILVAYLLLVGLITAASPSVGSHHLRSVPPQIIPPVQLSVTVTNKKGFVTALKQENFQISVDKVPAKIVSFSNDDAPVSVGILLDASASMLKLLADKRSRLQTLQQALAAFVDRSNKANEYFMIGFNERAELWTDWTSGAPLLKSDDTMRLRPKGNTALYDAYQLALEKVQQGRHSRRAMILISDGLDNASQIEFEEMRKLVREAGIPLYSLNTSEERDFSFRLEGQATLNELTSASGGVLYTTYNFTRDVNEIFEAIANELRNQYLVAIEPLPASNQRKWRKIKVKASLPADAPPELKSLSVRTRPGYYSL